MFWKIKKEKKNGNNRICELNEYKTKEEHYNLDLFLLLIKFN